LPVSDLCRNYGISVNTYYKLKARFVAGGVQGLQNDDRKQIKALKQRIKELKQALRGKNLEVKVLKENVAFQQPQNSYASLIAELRKNGLVLKILFKEGLFQNL